MPGNQCKRRKVTTDVQRKRGSAERPVRGWPMSGKTAK